MSFNPANVGFERFEPFEFDRHSMSDHWPLNEFNLASISRQVENADPITAAPPRAQTYIGGN